MPSSEYFIVVSSPETARSSRPFEPPQITPTPRLPKGPMSLGGSRQKEAVCQLGVISRDTACSLWQDQVLHERGKVEKERGRTGVKFSGVRSRLKDHWGPFWLRKKKGKKKKKASPKDCYAKQPRWSIGYREEKKKKLYSVIRSNMVEQKDRLRPPENGM